MPYRLIDTGVFLLDDEVTRTVPRDPALSKKHPAAVVRGSRLDRNVVGNNLIITTLILGIVTVSVFPEMVYAAASRV